ncbi:MAG: cation:proton antiporter [Acidimicrobiales bacterium]
MSASDVALLALVTFGLNLVSAQIRRWYLTLPMLFTAAGLILGPEVTDIVQIQIEAAGIELLAEVTLVLVLFSDASRIDLVLLRRQAALPARLLLIAFPLTIAAGTAVGWLLWNDTNIWMLALLATILAPTDAALGQAVVSSPEVPVRVRTTLNVESGLNDGLAVPLLTVFITLIEAGEDVADPVSWVQLAAEQIGLGILAGLAIGVAGGKLVEWASERRSAEPGSRRVAALTLAVAAAAGSAAIGGNPFIAAFVAGAALRRVAPESCSRLYEFLEREGELLTQIAFFIFGAALAGIALTSLTPRAVVYALLSLTVIRLLPVALSLIGSGLRRDTVAFIGWFGPRGLASIVFILTAIGETELTADNELMVAACLTIVLSIVTHGLSAQPLSRLYGQQLEEVPDEEAEEMEEMEEMHELPVRGSTRPMH